MIFHPHDVQSVMTYSIITMDSVTWPHPSSSGCACMPTSMPGTVKESLLPISGVVQRSPFILIDVFIIGRRQAAQRQSQKMPRRCLGWQHLDFTLTPEVTSLWLVRTLALSIAWIYHLKSVVSEQRSGLRWMWSSHPLKDKTWIHHCPKHLSDDALPLGPSANPPQSTYQLTLKPTGHRSLRLLAFTYPYFPLLPSLSIFRTKVLLNTPVFFFPFIVALFSHNSSTRILITYKS